MQHKHKSYATVILAFSMIVLASVACKMASSPTQWSPPPITQVVEVTQVVPVTQIVPDTMGMPLKPEIVLQRLAVSFLGQDGHKVIGSGCPGNDGKGTIIDYHLIVGNVEEDKKVQRIIVTGDNSTLTWEFPCVNAWALSTKALGNGIWEIFIAPSLRSRSYTVIIFYDDNSFAIGTDIAP